MNLKKSISVLCLCLVLFLPSLLLYVSKIQQWQVKYEMEERLESENLQTITLALENVEWFEQGREIMVEGKLFDVKSYSQQGALIVFTGLFDDKESAIRKQVEFLQKQSRQDQESNQLTAKAISLLLFIDQLPNNFTSIALVQESTSFRWHDAALVAAFLPISTPPPKI